MRENNWVLSSTSHHLAENRSVCSLWCRRALDCDQARFQPELQRGNEDLSIVHFAPFHLQPTPHLHNKHSGWFRFQFTVQFKWEVGWVKSTSILALSPHSPQSKVTVRGGAGSSFAFACIKSPEINGESRFSYHTHQIQWFPFQLVLNTGHHKGQPTQSYNCIMALEFCEPGTICVTCEARRTGSDWTWHLLPKL